MALPNCIFIRWYHLTKVTRKVLQKLTNRRWRLWIQFCPLRTHIRLWRVRIAPRKSRLSHLWTRLLWILMQVETIESISKIIKVWLFTKSSEFFSPESSCTILNEPRHQEIRMRSRRTQPRVHWKSDWCEAPKLMPRPKTSAKRGSFRYNYDECLPDFNELFKSQLNLLEMASNVAMATF